MLNERSIATVKNAYLVLILVVCTLVNLFVYYKNCSLILMSILTITCLGSLYLKRNQYDNGNLQNHCGYLSSTGANHNSTSTLSLSELRSESIEKNLS